MLVFLEKGQATYSPITDIMDEIESEKQHTKLPLSEIPPDTHVFHAGTKLNDQGQTVTAGGRVLTVVGQGPDLPTARQRAYTAAAQIHFPHKHHRTDIAASFP